MSLAASAEPMVLRRGPLGEAAPVVFDSPHSGRYYPADFRAAVPLEMLKGGEDRFVDELAWPAAEHGATVIVANFARTYLDPNRRVDDLDPALLAEPWPAPLAPTIHSSRGVGLLFRKIGPDLPIYDRLLSLEEVRRRIDLCWRPYHDMLRQALDAAHSKAGAVWHINIHSMAATGNELSPDPGETRADFVLGDLEGRSCAPEFTGFVRDALHDLGYSVRLNHPYRGAELVERHGHPQSGRHSLQIEINRGLYMNAGDLRKHAGFDRLRQDIGVLAARICAFARGAVRQVEAAPARPG